MIVIVGMRAGHRPALPSLIEFASGFGGTGMKHGTSPY
jgi:hypothetical protein